MNKQTEVTTPDYQDYKNWIKALGLKIRDIEAAVNYAWATDYCSNCPSRVDDDHPNAGGVCCRESDDFQANFDDSFASDYAEIERIKEAQKALMALIPEDER